MERWLSSWGTRFSCRGPMFGPQDPHGSLKTIVPGIQYPLWTPQAPTYMRMPTQRHTRNTQLKIKFIFSSNSLFCWYFLYFHFSIWLVSVLCFSCFLFPPSSLSSLSSPGSSSFFLFSKHWWWRSGSFFFFSGQMFTTISLLFWQCSTSFCKLYIVFSWLQVFFLKNCLFLFHVWVLCLHVYRCTAYGPGT